MTKPVTWSHSGLKDFEGCARRYYEVKVLKNFPQQETEQMRYGTALHEAAELFVKEGKPLPKEFEFIKPTLDALMSKPGRKLPEHEMALREDLTPCGFKDPDYWVRGIADLLIINDDDLTAKVVDYKTGNDKYPDRDQLVLMSLMVFAHFPHIRQVDSALLFVVKESMVKHRMTREDVESAWWQYRLRVSKLVASVSNNVWHPNQTPLCKWCPVKSCEFNPKH